MFRVVVLGAGLLAVALPTIRAAERPRVYVEESRSWTLNGWSPLTGLLGALGGGDRPQTVEILHTLTKRCPQVTPTRRREDADFVLVLEREGGKSIFRKDNKFAVFSAAGELVKVGSTRMLSSAVSEACAAIAAEPPAGPRPVPPPSPPRVQ